MKTTIAFLLLLLLVPLSHAQFPDPVPSWTKFAPLNEEFSIETPVNLGVRGDDKATSSRKYYGSINGSYVYIFSDPVRSPYYISTINRYIADWRQNELSAETTAKRITYQDTFGYTHHIAVVRTEARIYLVQAVSLAEKDAVSTRFVDSLAISDEKLPIADAPEQPDPTPGGVIVPYDEKSGGSGNGMGSGNGTGWANSGIPPAPKEAPLKPFAGQTSTLKILSRPRPSYTNLARFYEITGTVRLRVTFSGKGQIGPVSAISTLPFGLTEKAMNAARQMTFEPEYRKGKGLDVTKAVEYTFSIY